MRRFEKRDETERGVRGGPVAALRCLFRPSGKQPVLTRRSDAEAQRRGEPNPGPIKDSPGADTRGRWRRCLGRPRRSFQILGMWRAEQANRRGEEERSRLGFSRLFTTTAGSW